MTDDRTGGTREGPGSSQASSGSPGIPIGSLEEQLARTQERLVFYEGFDRLIQDNIARSAELMREAMDLRERAQREIAQGHAQAERRILTEREKQRLVFTSLLDELAEVQQSAERVARRMTQALEEIGAALPEHAPIGTNGDSTSLNQLETADDEGVEPFILAAPTATSEESSPAASESATGADTEVKEVSAAALTFVDEPAALDVATVPAAAETAPGEPRRRPEPGTSADRDASGQPPAMRAGSTEAPAQAATPATEEAAAPAQVEPPEEQGSRVVMVLVHGVPRAAAALSLQRHLAGLAHVDGVEAREYAEGILRLQVTARRPLDLQDLQTWDGATGMEPVHIQRDVVEVKLPGAETF